MSVDDSNIHALPVAARHVEQHLQSGGEGGTFEGMADISVRLAKVEGGIHVMQWAVGGRRSLSPLDRGDGDTCSPDPAAPRPGLGLRSAGFHSSGPD